MPTRNGICASEGCGTVECGGQINGPDRNAPTATTSPKTQTTTMRVKVTISLLKDQPSDPATILVYELALTLATVPLTTKTRGVSDRATSGSGQVRRLTGVHSWSAR